MDTLKFFALHEEFETADKLIGLGLGELQNISFSNDFYFLPFQLLSQGFERFMKAYICIGFFEKEKKLPDSEYLRQDGHNLMKLLNRIKKEYYKEYPPEQFQKDLQFLNDDEDLKELLLFLSEFGKVGRYYNFDFITDNPKKSKNPKKSWEEFENKFVPRHKGLKEKFYDNRDEGVFNPIINDIVIVIEKFISSLSRQMIRKQTFGPIGAQLTINSFRHYNNLDEFENESDFGKHDYPEKKLKS